MRKLIRHELQSELVWPFFQKTLANANALSTELLRHFDGNRGHFFTLLPESANIQNIYHFESGNILPQNPIQRGKVGSLPGTYNYSVIPSITDDLASIIGTTLANDDHVTCIIDDVIRHSNDKIIKEFSDEFKNCMAYSGREVYYLLDKMNAQVSLIVKCLQYSRAFWHSLCVLSRVYCKDYVANELDSPIFTKICTNVQMVIVGAYDGEGYIFWEKHD